MNVGSTSNSSLLQQLMQSLFTTADTNNDGQLSSTEFQSMGQNVQAGGANAPTGSTDTGSLLDTATLTALLALQQQQQSQQSSQTSGGPPPSDADRFAAADTDGDGEISADELTAAMAKHAPQGAQGNVADDSAKLLKALDANGDGKLSQAEFAAMPHHGHHGHHGGGEQVASATGTDSSSSTTYNAADTNKDGVVSAAELMASLSQVQSDLGSDVSGSAMTSLSQLLQQLSPPSASGGVSATA